jgi:HlyD family secretion protein
MPRIPFLPVLAVAGVVTAGFVVADNDRRMTPAAPLTDPAQAPFAHTVAGAGLVEPSTRPIAIGTPIAGTVAQVNVAVGDQVTAGQPLLQIDARSTTAELAVRTAEVEQQRRRLERLQALPRPEQLPPAEAAVASARARQQDALALVSNLEAVTDPRAVRREELQQRRFAAETATANLAAAEAELALLRAGAWDRELAEARAAVAAAEAQRARVEIELDRHIVRAPRAATVLQVDVRAGEYASASNGAGGDRLLLLGDVEVLHVRTDIDENDAFRIRPDARAFASLRGDPRQRTELRFVHIEPFVIPKRSLTGSTFERVDTRVLQVVYAFDPKALPAFVGQQLDVFVEAGAQR